MKKDKFPNELYVTCDGDEDGYYPIAFEEIPEQDGDRVAIYKKVCEGKIQVDTVIKADKVKEPK